jgi:predicted negative regulator of RcsB-dependent stress response
MVLISLTALGVIVTVLIVIIAVATIFGWQAMRGAAAKTARKAVDVYLKSAEFKGMLQQVVFDEVASQYRAKLKVTIEHEERADYGNGSPRPFKG